MFHLQHSEQKTKQQRNVTLSCSNKQIVAGVYFNKQKLFISESKINIVLCLLGFKNKALQEQRI